MTTDDTGSTETEAAAPIEAGSAGPIEAVAGPPIESGAGAVPGEARANLSVAVTGAGGG